MNYIDKIAKEPLKENYNKEDFLRDDYLIASENNIEIYYAPFDYVNLDASVIIVGITPGWKQMEKSFITLIKEFYKDQNHIEALRKVKSESSFDGPMRINLIKMLNEIGLNSKLGIECTSELFDQDNQLLHSTSAIRYPVFKNGRNYTGSSPSPIKTDILWNLINKYLVSELNQFNGKLIIPLGKSVNEIFNKLQNEDFVKNNYVLNGFPHPSGGNGHRVRLFKENKEFMTETILNWDKQ